MKTVQEVLALSLEYLQKRGISSPRREAEEVVGAALRMKRLDLYLEFGRPLIEEELQICRHFLERRGRGEPLAYISQEVEFYGCRLRISPAALIPRPETELLVDKVAYELAGLGELNGKVLCDLCCGSGAIGIALKKRFSCLEVLLSDLSSEALGLAAENARLSGVKVALFEGDLLEPLRDVKIDFLVCNPPYISQKEYATLDREVRAFEPSMALVGGPTGLEFYERLAGALFPETRRAWMEVGSGQGAAAAAFFIDRGWKCRIEKDWSGHDRFLFLEKNAG